MDNADGFRHDFCKWVRVMNGFRPILGLLCLVALTACSSTPSTQAAENRRTAAHPPAAAPAADPSREFLYAASPDGRIQKLAVADGHAVWSASVPRLPAREKIASALNYFQGRVIAVTGGYIGDRAPYQGHVAILDAA